MLVRVYTCQMPHCWKSHIMAQLSSEDRLIPTSLFPTIPEQSNDLQIWYFREMDVAFTERGRTEL